jgi:hypothetical protein
VEGLSSNERDLVKMVLLQLVNTQTNDDETLSLMIQALDNLLRIEKAESHDFEFGCLDTLFAFVASGKISYSQKVFESLQSILCKSKVSSLEN